jgi:hypothetical protein
MLKLESKNSSVVRYGQNWHEPVAVEFCRYPPTFAMYVLRYCPHVCPDGGTIETNSTEAHSTSWWPTAVKQ